MPATSSDAGRILHVTPRVIFGFIGQESVTQKGWEVFPCEAQKANGEKDCRPVLLTVHVHMLADHAMMMPEAGTQHSISSSIA